MAIILSKFFFSFDQQQLIQALLAVTIIYVGWGIFHHHQEHDLSTKIVIEYILIAGIAMVIVMIALRGGL